MSIEENLKQYILNIYKSVRAFSIAIGMPYSTIDNIFKRGIGKANVLNIIKICKELGIQVDPLMDGRIVSKDGIELLSQNNILENSENQLNNGIVSNRLVAERKKSNLSRSDLSEKTKIPYETYCQYELGIKKPQADEVAALARTLCTSSDYLLGLIDDPSPVVSANKSLLDMSSDEIKAALKKQHAGEEKVTLVALGGGVEGEVTLSKENYENLFNLAKSISEKSDERK